MKCQHCEKPATFHITEVLGADGPQVMHLCEEHAKAFLTQSSPSPSATVAGLFRLTNQDDEPDVQTRLIFGVDF